jgi:hypothetical protein
LADDESNTLKLSNPPSETLARTTWTLLLYITSASDGCEGGDTVFYLNDRKMAKDEIAVAPETGMVCPTSAFIALVTMSTFGSPLDCTHTMAKASETSKTAAELTVDLGIVVAA